MKRKRERGRYFTERRRETRSPAAARGVTVAADDSGSGGGLSCNNSETAATEIVLHLFVDYVSASFLFLLVFNESGSDGVVEDLEFEDGGGGSIEVI
ncbi:hypothetical protein A2U01_0015411 [Trifolium medium]|uniref:Uncharacterized protein n=1 Tax=Trifolium medium TaxID=97028 RepID=A0A392N402_9FABA|nr:hypothetical protein [Trifolium medium]